MTYYCTLAQARAELKAESTIEDDILRGYIIQVSRRIDLVMGSGRRPYFAPYTEQRRRNITSLRVNSYENSFALDYNILSVSNVTIAGEDVTSKVELYAPNNEVATMLRLTDNSTSWYSVCGSGTGTPPYVLKVTGEWGWHSDYDNAWEDVDTLSANITDSATTLTVSDITGENSDWFEPSLSAGNLIKINSELMLVVATSSIARVKRGVNGTTAAAHTSGDTVSVYRMDERIQRIAARQSALLFARRAAFQVETLDGVGVVSYPQDLLSELKGVLTGFMYV